MKLLVGRFFESFFTLFLVVLIMLVSSSSVLVGAVPANPDDISMESVRVFQNIFESGDFLFVFEHKVTYASEPAEDPEDIFLVGIWEGAVKGPETPITDYQHHVSSIYLTAAEATSFSIAWEDTLTVAVMGNPAVFAPLIENTNKDTYGLTPGNWASGTESESREALADWIIDLAKELETSWSLTLLSASNKLNATGSAAFLMSIPGLNTVIPDSFMVSASYPDYTDPVYVPDYQTELDTHTGARLTASLEAIGQWMTGQAGFGSMIGAMGLAILFFILAGRIFVSTGSAPAAIAISIPFLFVGNIIGVLSLSITFIAAFLVAVVFAVTFILGRF